MHLFVSQVPNQLFLNKTLASVAPRHDDWAMHGFLPREVLFQAANLAHQWLNRCWLARVRELEVLKENFGSGPDIQTVSTYFVLSGKKTARSPPAEICNSKDHAKKHKPPLETAENRPEITEAPAALQKNGRRHIQNSNSGLLINWFYSSNLPTSFWPPKNPAPP